MRIFKVVGAYEKDGVTPKEETVKLNYQNRVIGRELFEYSPIVVGNEMVLQFADGDSEGFLHTTVVNKIEDVLDLIRITTKNTIYDFKVIENYNDF